MESLPIFLLLASLRALPVPALQCMTGEGRLSDPDNFVLMECEHEPGRYGELVCYKQFGKDLGDQIRRGCTYFWPHVIKSHNLIFPTVVN